MPEDDEGDPWASVKPEKRVADGKVRVSYNIQKRTREAIEDLAKAYGVMPGQALDSLIRENAIRRQS